MTSIEQMPEVIWEEIEEVTTYDRQALTGLLETLPKDNLVADLNSAIRSFRTLGKCDHDAGRAKTRIESGEAAERLRSNIKSMSEALLLLEGQSQQESLFAPFAQIKTPRSLSFVFLVGGRFRDLRNYRICRSVLRGADFTSANLHRATILDSDLSNANLTGANLSHVDCRGTKFVQSVLKQADLTGAKFENVDLSDADLTDARFRTLRSLLRCLRMPNGGGLISAGSATCSKRSTQNIRKKRRTRGFICSWRYPPIGARFNWKNHRRAALRIMRIGVSVR